MRRAVSLVSALVLASCGSHIVATTASATTKPTVDSTAAASAPATAASGTQEAVLGPAGMTLQQEIGAVMMVGFTGPLTPAVLKDWRQHQFGGLIVVPIYKNAEDATAIRQLIQSVRGVMLHPLMAATNSELPTIASGAKALGFDINFAPVGDGKDVTAAIAGIHAAGMYAAAEHFPSG